MKQIEDILSEWTAARLSSDYYGGGKAIALEPREIIREAEATIRRLRPLAETAERLKRGDIDVLEKIARVLTKMRRGDPDAPSAPSDFIFCPDGTSQLVYSKFAWHDALPEAEAVLSVLTAPVSSIKPRNGPP